MEIRFPGNLAAGKSPASEFDKAVAALNQRRFDDCVAACRGLVASWNEYYKADKATPMGDAIGNIRGWAPDDQRRSLVSGIWKALIDATNAAHHPEDDETAQEFDQADARMVLYQVAVMSEFLS
jgi:hypothetical protein